MGARLDTKTPFVTEDAATVADSGTGGTGGGADGPAEEYQPGICNIGAAEIARRRQAAVPW